MAVAHSTARRRDEQATAPARLGGPISNASTNAEPCFAVMLVEVRDSGMGMDEATQRRMFEPFFSTKPRGQRLGLGSCLSVVAARGGAILVESALGRGRTFSLLLDGTRSRTRAAELIQAVQRARRG